MPTMTPRAPRRFIESQLSPTLQAFGYGGGWSIERRTKRQAREREPLSALAASLEPWPCAASDCKGMVHWRPKKATTGRRCTARSGVTGELGVNVILKSSPPSSVAPTRILQAVLPKPAPRAAEADSEKKGAKAWAQWTPEQKARCLAYQRRWRASRTPAQHERDKERGRQWQRARLARRTPEQLAQLAQNHERQRRQRLQELEALARELPPRPCAGPHATVWFVAPYRRCPGGSSRRCPRARSIARCAADGAPQRNAAPAEAAARRKRRPGGAGPSSEPI